MENGGWALRGEFLRRTFQSGDAETVAVDDVSLDLQAGQVALLMGPSGCGKSTLLSLLSGLLRPDAGTVFVLGENLWTMNDTRRRLFRLRHFGFVFQGHNLFPTLTAREQLELTLEWGNSGGSSARRRAEEVLEMLGIASRCDLLPLHLSGGEKQRVAIGRALIKQPSFCFADEPTSALDWRHGQGVIELLQQAARQRNTAVLLVSHDPRIRPYVDRTFHMEDGRLRESPSAE
jgi:putative ABC transport system ATP-binding protein